MEFSVEAESGGKILLSNYAVVANNIANVTITEQSDHWSVKLPTEQGYTFSSDNANDSFCVQLGLYEGFVVRPELTWGFAKFQVDSDMTVSVYLDEYGCCEQVYLAGEGSYLIGLSVAPIVSRPASYGIITGEHHSTMPLYIRQAEYRHYTLQNMTQVSAYSYYCEAWGEDIVDEAEEQGDITQKIVLFGDSRYLLQSYLPFDDVLESDWFYYATAYAENNGWMNGTVEGIFSPQESVSRAMLVTILHRAERTPAAGNSNFTDVVSGSYYAAAVSWAQENGIVKGTSDTTFSPDQNISREQIATILMRYVEYKNETLDANSGLVASSFADYSSVSGYAKDAMDWAVSVGLISGKDTDTLAPNGIATRAEAATLLQRLSNVLG